jgi:hypothetical protein
MLSLANCGSIQDKCVEQMCANMASTSLTLLNLSRCKGLTGASHPHRQTHTRNRSHASHTFSDKSVEYLMNAKSLTSLQKLILSGNVLSSHILCAWFVN